MTLVSCKLPKKLAAQLERLARDEPRSKQAVLREAIEIRLKVGQKAVRGSVYDSIKHLIGSLEGPSDLATNPLHMEGFAE